MAKYRIISSDSHILEPPDLWTSRIDPKFRDRAPYTVREDGKDLWYVEKDLKVGVTALFSQAGKRFGQREEIAFGGGPEDVRPGGYDPDERLKDMDADGVYGDLLYPSLGLLLFKVPDSELLSAMFRAYNDWLAEFCAAYPNRLKGVAMVNVDDVQDGIGELERARNMGMAGAMISVYPSPDQQYDLPVYEPLWAAAQDLGMPISLHTSTHRPGPLVGGLGENQTFTRRVNNEFWVKNSLSNLIYTGVLERYPKLRFVVVEFELSWVPFFLDRLDYTYLERQAAATYRFKNDLLPRDLFHNNVYLSFQEDDLGIQLRHIIGVDNLMWGSDYPHAESTFPKSQEILERILQGVPEEDKAKIAGGSAAKIYHFN